MKWNIVCNQPDQIRMQYKKEPIFITIKRVSCYHGSFRPSADTENGFVNDFITSSVEIWCSFIQGTYHHNYVYKPIIDNWDDNYNFVSCPIFHGWFWQERKKRISDDIVIPDAISSLVNLLIAKNQELPTMEAIVNLIKANTLP